MSEKYLPVKEEEDFDVISLDQEDETYQYTIVPNALIRDKSISPNCRWLIIYLISNKPGWTIKSRQIWEHTKGFAGRDKIRNILNEAIEAGYIQRKIILRDSPKGKLRGCSYTVASTPKFKKCLRKPENQVPDLQETNLQKPDIQAAKEVLSKELLSIRNNSSLKVPDKEPAIAVSAKAAEEILNSSSKEKPKKAKLPEDFTPKVQEVAKQMINCLRRSKPNYVPTRNLSSFLTHVDYLLRLDNREPQLIIDVFSWALADSFWADKMYKPNPAEYLRKQFDQLEMKMNAKPPANSNKVDRRVLNKDGTDEDAYKDFLF